ncbi:hypothetical protein Snoj_59120 [Streptomyces nojiriensis]|uniref:Phage holin family protein n=1 Tax=Streptomyces nojiriensis TaxID=66374 RepID=A0ABQ3SV24_9ACTN|nr:DUF6251 family protein [Streptomyces nojiriensis]QTI45531.1 hypothetical protein JYK04_03324 [Streptomyces nojiriensis]GGR96556.1 hypothetical protein GCM10010205_26660 [Streptomyces nojiriensis]GHI71994.1 hypothetical protein Snoj_59120 [Streptomyces nojiriensis]
MNHLPEPARVVRLPDGTHVYADQMPVTFQSGPQVVHQHIHQAPPDRTVQRLALGSGIGAGAVAAGVYFGPLLVGALTAIAANIAMLAFLALILAWGVHTVVKSTGSSEGATAVKNARRLARRSRR